jgi:hypothetical protein
VGVLDVDDDGGQDSHLRTVQYTEQSDTLDPEETVLIMGRVITRESNIERLPSIELVGVDEQRTKKGTSVRSASQTLESPTRVSFFVLLYRVSVNN